MIITQVKASWSSRDNVNKRQHRSWAFLWNLSGNFVLRMGDGMRGAGDMSVQVDVNPQSVVLCSVLSALSGNSGKMHTSRLRPRPPESEWDPGIGSSASSGLTPTHIEMWDHCSSEECFLFLKALWMFTCDNTTLSSYWLQKLQLSISLDDGDCFLSVCVNNFLEGGCRNDEWYARCVCV